MFNFGKLNNVVTDEAQKFVTLMQIFGIFTRAPVRRSADSFQNSPTALRQSRRAANHANKLLIQHIDFEFSLMLSVDFKIPSD